MEKEDMNLRSKLTKAWAALEHPLWRRALCHGVAPTIEHRPLLEQIGPFATVVDVGANVGQFALLCRVLYPNARIHSFEPMSSAADVFDKVFAQQTGVELHRSALGRAGGRTNIHVTRRADSSSLLEPKAQSEIFPGTDVTGTEEVIVATLAEALDGKELRQPALLKIDVQGFEGEVLKGCSSLLYRFEYIFVEASFIELYANQPLAHEIVAWLRDRSFDLEGVYMGTHSVRHGLAVQGDFLFRRRTS